MFSAVWPRIGADGSAFRANRPRPKGRHQHVIRPGRSVDYHLGVALVALHCGRTPFAGSSVPPPAPAWSSRRIRHAPSRLRARARQQGHDTRAIQGWLGHQSITSTAIYAALAPNWFKDFWRD
jgi:hypothetical protein